MSKMETAQWIKATIRELDELIENNAELKYAPCAPEIQAIHSMAEDLDIMEKDISHLKSAWIKAEGHNVTIDQLTMARDQLRNLLVAGLIDSVEEDEDLPEDEGNLEETTVDASMEDQENLDPPALDSLFLRADVPFEDEEPEEGLIDQGPRPLTPVASEEHEDDLGFDWDLDEDVPVQTEEEPETDAAPSPRRRFSTISQRGMLWGLGLLSVLVLFSGGSWCVMNPDGSIAKERQARRQAELAARPVIAFPCGSTGQLASQGVTYQVEGATSDAQGACVLLETGVVIDRGCLPGLESGHACPDIIRTFTCGVEGQFTSKGVTYQVVGGTSDMNGVCVRLDTGVAIDHACLFGSMASEKCPAVKPVR